MKPTRLLWCGLLITSIMVVGACKKEAEPATDAVVLHDPRLCPCCGGFVINLDGSTSPFAASAAAIANSADVGISAADNFPLYVQVNYVTVSNGCRPTIKITRLKKK